MASDAIPLATLIHMITIRLTSSNYLLWKNQMSLILRCDGSLPIADGSESAPAKTLADTTDVNPDYANWSRRHDRCLSLLLASLTEESMTEILGLHTIRDIWVALERTFCPATESRTHQLRDELQFFKRGSTSVTEFTRKFSTLCHQLAAVGSPVTDSNKIRWFFRGLGPDFRTFADVRLAISPTPNFSDLISQARDHELRNNFATDVVDSAPAQVAFYAGRNNSRGGRNSGGSRNSGGQHNSGGQGRGQSSDNQQQRCGSNPNNHQRRNYTPRCQICRDAHYAPDCPERYKQRSSDTNIAQAFKSQCNIVDTSPSNWYVDTGASAHMTGTPSNLDSVSSYSEPQDQINHGKRSL